MQTPGPWKLCHTDAGAIGIAPPDGRFVYLAEILIGENLTHAELAEQEANARLMAAAPDLLDHGKAAFDGMQEAIRVLDLMGRGHEARALAVYRSNLGFAIAKATGGAS